MINYRRVYATKRNSEWTSEWMRLEISQSYLNNHPSMCQRQTKLNKRRRSMNSSSFSPTYEFSCVHFETRDLHSNTIVRLDHQILKIRVELQERRGFSPYVRFRLVTRWIGARLVLHITRNALKIRFEFDENRANTPFGYVRGARWNRSTDRFYKRCPSKHRMWHLFEIGNGFLTMVTWVTIASTTSCLNGRKTMAWYFTGKIT